MKLEVGKYYKTVTGRKAKVLELNRPCSSWPIVCMYPDTGGLEHFDRGHISEYGDRLVSEWKDPIKVEVWVNVYRDHQNAWNTERAANNAATEARLACVRLTGEYNE